MPQFVYFDLGNVLWTFDEDVACQRVAELTGVSNDQVRRALYQSGLQNRFEHGQLGCEPFAEALLSEIGSPAKRPQTQALLDAASDMFTPIESMVDVLAGVRESGASLGILSNTCHAHWDWIKRQGHSLMQRPFDTTILSFEVGSMKPAPSIYQAAEVAAKTVAGVSPEEILFLDDKEENVRAAIQRGWRAQTCLGGREAIDALIQHGVLDSTFS